MRTRGGPSLLLGRADRHGVVGAVEDRAGQVVEAGVDQIERVLAGRFDRADFADEVAALGDQVAARFDLQRNLVAELVGQPVAGRVPQFEVGRRRRRTLRLRGRAPAGRRRR